MRKLFLILPIILATLGCDSQSELEGLWIGAYKIHLHDSGQTLSPLSSLLHFHEDVIIIKSLNYEDLANGKSNQEWRFEFQNNFLLMKDGNEAGEIFVKYFSNDSLVIQLNDSIPEHLVYKKIIRTKSVSFATLENKAFVLSSINYVDSIDFINNKQIYHLGNLSASSYGYWKIEKYLNTSFLIMGDLFWPPLVLSSVENRVYHLHSYQATIVDYELKEISTKLNLNLLVGSWKAISKLSQLLPNINNYTKGTIELIITEDSITSNIYGKNITRSWISNSTNQYIFFPNQKFPYHRIWRILELTESSLTIERENIEPIYDDSEIIKFKKL